MPKTQSHRWPAGLAIALACGYLVAELFILGRPGFPLDDSWIHLQFARQLASGDGLSYNPGQWIGGSTSPLWTALLSLGFLLPGGGFLLYTKALGIVLFAVGVDAAARLAGELGLGPKWRTLAAVLVATSHWLLWSALSGMEVPLFTVLATWGLILHLRERRAARLDPSRFDPPRSLAVLALATLARPEGLVPLTLALVERCLRFEGTPDGVRLRREPTRRVLPGLAVGALVLGPTPAVYGWLGGSVVPSTFTAKTATDGGLWPDGGYLLLVLDVLARSQPVLIFFAAAGALRLAGWLGTGRDRGWLPAAWLLAQPLAYSLVASPGAPPPLGNFGRYYFPLLPLVVVVGLVGLESLVRGRALWLGRRRLGAFALVAVAAVGIQLASLLPGPLRYVQTVANVEDSDVAAALWLRPRLHPEAVLAVQDIGALKFFLPNPVIDLVGIVTPEVVPHLRGSGPDDPVYWEERLARYLAREKPDYLVVFAESYPLLSGRADGFEPVHRISVQGNVTMAGSELVIVATPWNRHPLRSP